MGKMIKYQASSPFITPEPYGHSELNPPKITVFVLIAQNKEQNKKCVI